MLKISEKDVIFLLRIIVEHRRTIWSGGREADLPIAQHLDLTNADMQRICGVSRHTVNVRLKSLKLNGWMYRTGGGHRRAGMLREPVRHRITDMAIRRREDIDLRARTIVMRWARAGRKVPTGLFGDDSLETLQKEEREHRLMMEARKSGIEVHD